MTVDTSVEETTAESALDNEATEPHTTQDEETEGQEPEGTESSEDGDDTPAKPKPDGFQKRINQLTRRLREAERKLAQQEAPPKPKEEPKGPPKLEDFGQDHQGFISAVARYEAQQALAAERQQQTSAQEQAKQQERLVKFMTADEAFQDSNADYRGAYELGQDPTFPITDSVLEAIVESDTGPALLHYLDTHRDEAASISQMSPARAAAAIGRLEAKLEAPPVQPAKPVSNAPSPVPTVKPSAPVKKDPEKMSMDEYIKWRGQKRN